MYSLLLCLEQWTQVLANLDCIWLICGRAGKIRVKMFKIILFSFCFFFSQSFSPLLCAQHNSHSPSFSFLYWSLFTSSFYQYVIHQGSYLYFFFLLVTNDSHAERIQKDTVKGLERYVGVSILKVFPRLLRFILNNTIWFL